MNLACKNHIEVSGVLRDNVESFYIFIFIIPRIDLSCNSIDLQTEQATSCCWGLLEV